VSETEEIEIVLVGINRLLRPEIARTNSIKTQVIYEFGSFDLVFGVDRLPTTKEGIRAELENLIVDFSDRLKKAAQKQIRIDWPDPPLS
jgi:hypothetical protein